MRGSIRAESAQSVTFVELFFDLVFVFAVTQLTVLTAHDLTPDGILRSILLGWLIWWAWTQFTWTLNPADTTHPLVRVDDPCGDRSGAGDGRVGAPRVRR